MSIIENILYGLASGLTEFLPISSRGHQMLLRYLFGIGTRISLQEILVHIGIMFSIFVACRDHIVKLRWEQKNALSSLRSKSRRMDSNSHYELRLLKTAIVPMLLVTVLINIFMNAEWKLFSLIWLFLVNGLILLIAEHARQGNRDAKTMSRFDGMLLGFFSGVSALPGLSGTGMTLSYSTARGADIQKAVNWAILLLLPSEIFAIGGDLIYIFSHGFGEVSALMVVGGVLSGFSAFCGGFVGISILRLLAANSSVFQFSYYSFGVALFTFMLNLFT